MLFDTFLSCHLLGRSEKGIEKGIGPFTQKVSVSHIRGQPGGMTEALSCSLLIQRK